MWARLPRLPHGQGGGALAACPPPLRALTTLLGGLLPCLPRLAEIAAAGQSAQGAGW